MRNDESRLDQAVRTLRSAQPNRDDIAAAAGRVADRIGLNAASCLRSEATVDTIQSCDDVQNLLPTYRAGALSDARSLLVQAHLRECGPCHRQFRSGWAAAAVDWSAPRVQRPSVWRPGISGWAMPSAIALLALLFFLYRAFWQVPPGVRAEVQSIDGPAYRMSAAGDRRLAPGDALGEGEQLRTGGGGHAVLRLSDGSTVEISERSVLGVGARGRNVTVALNDGAVIVQAAKRAAGRLYVQTPDCRVAVTGTVFSVNSGIKGSRVAVLEGSLHVLHAGTESLVQAGDQVSTSTNLSPEPVGQQIAWSQDRDKYLQLLAQFSTLERRLEQIPAPQLRYTSDLLARVPADTLLYVSIPNLGDFLSQANTIFHDQLQQSPVLKTWWNRGNGTNTEQLNATIGKLHTISHYLGDEVVVIGLKQPAGFAILANVQKSGLGDFLKEQFPATGKDPGIIVLDESAFRAAVPSAGTQPAVYALVLEHQVVFSGSVATLKQMDVQLAAGASGFAAGDFGQQIAAAYSRGAGIVLAADLHQMLEFRAATTQHTALEKSGMEGLRYLVAEHRELNGVPENHLALQFSGTRQRVASWLAPPAPMASLDFVTPNAAIAVAVLSKDPKAIADDIINMATPADGSQAGGSPSDDLRKADTRLKISLRDDLAANLGGEFLVSLDGAVLPAPAWKVVIGVRDAAALEKTIETLAQSMCQLEQGTHHHCVTIQSTQSDDERFYSIIDQTSGTVVAEYTFAGGYLVATSDRALLLKALRAHTTGDSLSHSSAFKAMLPKDENDNYSAVAYQNAGPTLAPLASQLSGETAAAIRQLTADAKPTAICAWGQDTRIEAGSNSRLFGFDFVALGGLFHPGNQQGESDVPH